MADRTVTYRLRAEIAQFRAQMAQAGASTRKAADDMTAATKSSKAFRDGLGTVGRAAGVVGAAAAVGLGAAVLAAANFDQAMSHVQAATHESATNMELLRKAAIQTGADTVFSASEAAGAIEELAKAGVSTADILGGGLNGALDLAAAGSLAVADAAEIAASALTQFQLQGEDVPHIADLLAAGAGKAQGSVTDLGYALKYAGVPANALGVSIEETTGVLAQFAAAGIVGEQAGTTLRSMLLSLAAPTNRARDIMDDYGISLYDAQGQFVGLESAAGQLQSKLGGLTEAERNHALEVLFGKNAIQGAITLYQGGAEAVADWTAKVDDSGYAAETAAIKMDNLKGDLEQLKGSLETALIGTGEGSQGPLRSLTQGLTDLVNAYNDLPDSAKGAVAGVLGFTAVAGGGLFVFSKTVDAVSGMRNAFDQLSISAPRAAGAVRGFARAGLALGAVVVTADLMQAAFEKVANTRLNTGTLSRDLEALANGRVSKNLEKLGDTFIDINDGWQVKANPISWISRWDPSGFETARDNVAALDESLASLVEAGRADEAAAAFERLAAKASEAGLSTADFNKLWPEYTTALGNAGDSTFGLTQWVDSLAVSTDSAAASTTRSMKAQERNAEALKKAQAAARATAGQFITLGDSLNDSSVSLKDWIQDMADQAAALRDFRKNAQEAARKGLDEGLIRSLQEAGPEGALRMRQLSNASKKEIAEANKAWQSGQREVRKYTNEVGELDSALEGLPRNLQSKVTASTAAARAEVASFKAWVSQQTAHIRIITDRGPGPQTTGSGFAGGGYTGDISPSAIAGIVHGREFVHDAEATARYRNLFEAIHRRQPITPSMLGNPPTVNVNTDTAAVVNRLERLERVMAAVPAATAAGVVREFDQGNAREMKREQW